MVLIDKDKGVLTKMQEFAENPGYTINKTAKPVQLGDLFRVHDYNYLMKVIDISNKLKESRGHNLIRFGKHYSYHCQ
jgi:hypothetical protein